MKEKSPTSGGGRQSSRRPQQQNNPRASNPRTPQRSGSGSKAPAQGQGSIKPAHPSAWSEKKPAGARPSSPYRKDSSRRSDQNFEKRYSTPGKRDTYQPRQGREKTEPGIPSPAARRFGPSSRPNSFQPQERTVKPLQSFRVEPINDAVPDGLETIPAGINLLTGRNPIREAIKTGRDLEKLMVARGELSGSARQIVSMAKEAGVMVQLVERRRLDQIAQNHQGMVAYASAYQYASFEEIFEAAKVQGQPPFVVILDQVTDPHNLGAVIRTAVCAGAHGVIVPIHRAAGLTPAAVKASAGAVEHIKVVRVGNLNQTIRTLKDKGLWIFAADQAGEDYRSVKIVGPCALVIGSEGEGISALTLKMCDHRLKIPMAGEIGSLNASVAAGILMYAAFNGRNPVVQQ